MDGVPPQGPQFIQPPEESIDKALCRKHPSLTPEWDGFLLVCVGCVLGEPEET